MLKLYDHIENVMEEQNIHQWYFEGGLNYFANDIMEALDIEDALEFAISINRAFQACGKLNVSFDRNFKRVYRFDGDNLIADWKISSLACYLIIINSKPIYSKVARAQLFFSLK